MRRLFTAGVIAAMLIIPTLTVHAATGFADPRFQQQWQQGEAVTPNFWGPLANAKDGQQEPYKEAQGGQRLVQYFDKGRMELTNGTVTNGLLASELIKGQVQIGDNAFQPQPPPSIAMAGDPSNTVPTYAQLTGVGAPLLAPASAKTGQVASAAISDTAQLTTINLQGLRPDETAATFAAFDGPTQHNVPQAFVDYRNNAGLPTIGYAISEPFFALVAVGGAPKSVMVQAFERRVLTYTSKNPDAFKVEMGNIGLHYFQWRYGNTNASSGACTQACVFIGSEGGPGLADATICLSIAGGGANPIGKTDTTGHYAAKVPDLLGHQETIIFWPVKAGYAFTPKYGGFPSYGGNQTLTGNFVATPASGTATDCGPQPFR